MLISHGPNGAGAYTVAGKPSPGTAPIGNNELLNENGVALMTGSSVALSYRDAPVSNPPNAGAMYFDDMLSHPTILAVLTRANLAPRH